MRLSYIAAAALLTLAALPAQAQSGAEPYRALGTEPFWSVTIDGATIRYQPAAGRAVAVAKPRPIVGFNGERYQARGLTVDITHVRCSDGMSDRIYHDTVRVEIGGRTLRGCGGEPLVERAATPLEGAWTVQSIAGRSPVAGTDPRLTFSGSRVQGSNGCNRFSGSFRFERGRLTVGPLAMTERACVRWGGGPPDKLLQLLGQRLTVSRNRSGKLVMSAGSGETLVLAPAQR
jgi:uncharacterized membrane protein